MIRTTAVLTALGLALTIPAATAGAAALLLGANQRLDGAALRKGVDLPNAAGHDRLRRFRVGVVDG